MQADSRIETIVAVNNSISAELARQDMAARGISLDGVALILLRDLREPWMEQCALALRYPGRPADRFLAQRRFLRFYWAAARLLRRLDRRANVQNVYIVNNDSLITAHLLALAERRNDLNVTVVAEGIMNFQDIGVANRSAWRWRVKPFIAALLGYRYKEPTSHLSGAFEPRVERVVSFAASGLKAPPEKVVLREFEHVEPRRVPDARVALVVLTGLNQWMEPARFEPFAHAFVDWLKTAGFRKIQIKRHPRVSAGLIEELLAGAEEVGAGEPIEAMASELEAGTILGTCCTALVTLKLMRPDLQCIDFGSDYYSEHAYNGDRSVETLLSATGVKLVQMAMVERGDEGKAGARI